MADVEKLPRFDISNEAWRSYCYTTPKGGEVFTIEGARTLILEKHEGGDRHRLIIKKPDSDEEMGMYVRPGWVAIVWQDHNGKHGITF